MPSEAPKGPVELPEELLQHIFSFLHETSDLRNLDEDRDARLGLSTLANVALANRAYSRIVRPELYHTLFVEDDPGAIRPTLFLKTLLEQPDIGELVREIYSGLWSVDPSHREQRKLASDADDISQVLQIAAGRAGVPALSWPNVRLNLWPSPAHVGLAMILPFAPYLRFLAFSLTDYVSDSLIMTALRDVSLPQLSEIQVSCGPSMPLDDFIELLQRPALSTFRAHGIECGDESTSALAKSSLSPKLQRVFFEESSTDAIGLARLLISAPGVTTLSGHWGSARTRKSKNGFGAIGQTLRDHGMKLESLHLDSEDAAELDSSLNTNSSLGDLKGLVSLRHLALPHHALCGQEDDGKMAERSPDYLMRILPRSLRSIEIRLAKDIEMFGFFENVLEEEAQAQLNMEYRVLDLQLLELVRSEGHPELCRLIVHRYDEFTCLEDAQALGWSMSRNDDTFTLHRRE
ncbi:hypothetical protein LTR27_010909 [Elasticomyces elasticus]|nr:hypothetical protein LTR27_010909 [Elasticomyces elasticus]